MPRHSQALIAALLLGLSAALSAAAAQGVPVPVPAPMPKANAAPAPPVPPPAASAAKSGPPMALDSAPSPLPAPVPPPTAIPSATVATAAGPINLDPAQRTLVDHVNAYLSGVQNLVGDFVQIAPNGARSEGKFYLQKPGRARFEYDPPSTVELIADGQAIAVRDNKLNTQDIYMLSQTPLRFLLADRIDLLKDTDVIGVYTDDVFATVVLEEKQVFGGTHRLMLMFGAKDFQLKQWTITDPQGYDTTVAVYNLDTTAKPDPAMFKINYERILQ